MDRSVKNDLRHNNPSSLQQGESLNRLLKKAMVFYNKIEYPHQTVYPLRHPKRFLNLKVAPLEKTVGQYYCELCNVHFQTALGLTPCCLNLLYCNEQLGKAAKTQKA